MRIRWVNDGGVMRQWVPYRGFTGKIGERDRVKQLAHWDERMLFFHGLGTADQLGHQWNHILLFFLSVTLRDLL